MRTRLIIAAGLAAVAAAGTVPALASPTSPIPPACVVAHGPSGADLQVGYAPNGPSDCVVLV
jgi:hypothetical protein